MNASAAPVAAVVLAGGRATRLGGADKPALTIAGRSLLSIAVSAATSAGARRVVVVGPARQGLMMPAEFTTERPPGGGPVPALRAGLELVTEPWLLLLAADLPFLRGGHLSVLLTAARKSSSGSGAIFEDEHGQPQWLAGCWQTVRLRTALAGYQGSSLGGMLGPLRPVRVTPRELMAPGVSSDAPPWFDCDTADDLALAVALAAQDRPTGK